MLSGGNSGLCIRPNVSHVRPRCLGVIPPLTYSSKPTVSPTDQHDSPTTRKLKNVKERHFAPGKGKTPVMQRMVGLMDENSPPS